MAASLEPGVNISAVARRYGINPQQFFGWCKRFREEASALVERPQEAALSFAPAILDTAAIPTPSPPLPPSASADGTIEVSVGAATIYIRGVVDPKTLALVFKALRSLT